MLQFKFSFSLLEDIMYICMNTYYKYIKYTYLCIFNVYKYIIEKDTLMFFILCIYTVYIIYTIYTHNTYKYVSIFTLYGISILSILGTYFCEKEYLSSYGPCIYFTTFYWKQMLDEVRNEKWLLRSYYSETCLEPREKSTMELFGKKS